jgi:dGTPase
LPPEFSGRIDNVGLHRVVADYIAGMTDRFAMDDHARLFSPHFGRG